MVVVVGGIAVVIGIASAGRARAQPAAPLTVDLAAEVGAAAPTGTIGGRAQLDLLPWLRLGGGLGVDGDGLQAAVDLRLRYADGAVGVLGGFGASLGNVAQCHDIAFSASCDALGTAAWLDVEAGVDVDADPFVFGVVGGVSSMANASDVCLDPMCSTRRYFVVLEAGRHFGGPRRATPLFTPLPASPPPTAPGAVTSSRAVELTAQARDASVRYRCDLVRALGAQVAALDRAYHDQVFATDPSIAFCLR